MKRLIVTSTLMLMAMIAAPANAAEEAVETSGAAAMESAQADADHGAPHKKVILKKKKKGKKKVVVVHRRPRHVVQPVVVHKRRVVVHSGPPVVETVHHVPARRREVTHRQYVRRPVEDRMLGLGVRLSGVTVEGEKLNLATVENPTMGGLGLQVRGKVSRNVGLELATDVLYGQTDDMKQTTVPIMLSAMYYIVPEGKFKVYGLLGAGVHLTKLEYDKGFRHDLVEIAGQAGGGLELRLSRDFSLNADLRFLGLYMNISDTRAIETKCQGLSGAITCGGVKDADKFNAGAQFMVGANIYF